MKYFKNKKVIIALSVCFIAFLILIAPILSRMPSPQSDQYKYDDLNGVDAGGANAWVIPSDSGVILVDAGWDSEGKAIKSIVAGRTVQAILLTHAHFDHTAAIEQFPNATVYVGPGDKELLKGERETDGVMAKMMANLTGAPAHHPKKIRVIQDNVPLIIDGQKITPIHVAGHTHGSVVYLWRKILFTGDTVVGRDGYVNELPKPLYANYKAVPRNLKKVLQHDFDVLADGHVGIHKNGYKLIKEYLAKNGFRELSSNLKEKTMSDSKATLVVTAVPNPEGMEEMQKYLKGVVPVLVGNGGEILVRAKADKAVVGDVNFGMILVMSFASKGAIETTFESDEYKALIPLRDKGFKKMDVTIVDAM